MWKAVIWWGWGGGGVGSGSALLRSTVVIISPAKIENVKRADGTFPACDVLGTPSVTPFCHRDV